MEHVIMEGNIRNLVRCDALIDIVFLDAVQSDTTAPIFHRNFSLYQNR
jgi:hypothetical protein